METVPNNNRGILVGCSTVFVILGLVLAYFLWNSWFASRAGKDALWWSTSHNFQIEIEMGGEIRRFESVGVPHSYENSDGWYFKDKSTGKAVIVDHGFIAQER